MDWLLDGGWGAHPVPCWVFCAAGYGFITSEDSEDEVFVHQVRREQPPTGGSCAAAGAGGWRSPAPRSPLRCLAVLWPPLPQSNIETTGYRSLKEGEDVEYDLVVAEDGKKKAFRVTGPGGAPPQVRAACPGWTGKRCSAGCVAGSMSAERLCLQAAHYSHQLSWASRDGGCLLPLPSCSLLTAGDAPPALPACLPAAG